MTPIRIRAGNGEQSSSNGCTTPCNRLSLEIGFRREEETDLDKSEEMHLIARRGVHAADRRRCPLCGARGCSGVRRRDTLRRKISDGGEEGLETLPLCETNWQCLAFEAAPIGLS